jgi:predicted MPP superfamily phosphohydrolase
MPQAIEHGIDLYLCGHTHGGQVRLPVIGAVLTSSRLGRRYVMGHYHEGRTHLYVSRGVGFEGLGAPRVRLFCPPEITLITLGGAERGGAGENDHRPPTADH